MTAPSSSAARDGEDRCGAQAKGVLDALLVCEQRAGHVGPHVQGRTYFDSSSAARDGDNDGLRDEIARVINAKTAGAPGLTWRPTDVADAVLALPALRRLTAERDEARAANERVEVLAVCPTLCDYDCETHCHEAHQPRFKRMHQPEHCPSELLRRALDGGA